MLRKPILLAIALTLTTVACGEAAADTTSQPAPSSSVASTVPASSEESGTPPSQPAGPTTSTTAAGAGSPAEPDDPGVPVPDDAQAAPDFELTLGEGGTFSLSAEQKPVYLVFWAEW